MKTNTWTCRPRSASARVFSSQAIWSAAMFGAFCGRLRTSDSSTTNRQPPRVNAYHGLPKRRSNHASDSGVGAVTDGVDRGTDRDRRRNGGCAARVAGRRHDWQEEETLSLQPVGAVGTSRRQVAQSKPRLPDRSPSAGGNHGRHRQAAGWCPRFQRRAAGFLHLPGNKPPAKSISTITGAARAKTPMNLSGPCGVYT